MLNRRQLANKARQFRKRRAVWAPLWGSAYDYRVKSQKIKPLLENMDRLGLLGKVILDAGSGSTVIRRGLRSYRKIICQSLNIRISLL